MPKHTTARLDYDEDFFAERQRESCETAKENGLEVKVAGTLDLFLDIDSKSSLQLAAKRLGELERRGIILDWEVTRSKSLNWHIHAHLAKHMTIPERIMLQCVLGSDLTHEYMNVNRYLSGMEENVIVLFEVKEKARAANSEEIECDIPF